jgi:hypothetical protein
MGIVKYLRPNEAADLVPSINENIERLTQLDALDRTIFACWVSKESPAWSMIYPIPSGLDSTKVSELSEQFEGGPDVSNKTNIGDVPAIIEKRAPSRAARAAKYLLSAIDLSLRGLVGPGRHIRARLRPWSSSLEPIETRPTLGAIAAICNADRLLASEGLHRASLIVLSKVCLRLSRSFDRAANRVLSRASN